MGSADSVGDDYQMSVGVVGKQQNYAMSQNRVGPGRTFMGANSDMGQDSGLNRQRSQALSQSSRQGAGSGSSQT